MGVTRHNIHRERGLVRASLGCSVCDPELEILDEVQQSDESLKDCFDPGKKHSFQSPGGALEQSNKHSQTVFIDCSLFLIGCLIGSGGLLLVVSHLFAVPLSVLWG
jgi:hypothetical protein